MRRVAGLLAVLVLAFPLPGVTAGMDAAASTSSARVARGQYLARIGNCAGCHTARGGKALAGGFALETEFGTFYTPNITPDDETGIGDWSRAQFRAALRRGQRPGGAPLYPACPYTSYTHVRPDDIDAIYAYLRTVPAVRHRTRTHALDFPYDLRFLVNAWQAVYFEPEELRPDPQRDADWNRGRYLVEGLGHCAECHRDRNALGAVRQGPHVPGGRVHGWRAPALHSSAQAGLQGWSVDKAAAFLRSGRNDHAAMMGPMAGVVFESLQHLTGADARAIATYLTSLPDTAIAHDRPERSIEPKMLEATMKQGARIYTDRCADCHGDKGEGSDGVVALAGNPSVMLSDPTNIARVVHAGGFPAATALHPRPYGMPPFYGLDDGERAAIATYIRRSWGNSAGVVTTIDLPDGAGR